MVESQEGFGTIKRLKKRMKKGEEGKLKKVEKRHFRVETVGRSRMG